MGRRCKHTFRPGCDNLEGRQLLSGPAGVLSVAATPPAVVIPTTEHHRHIRHYSQKLQADLAPQPSGVPGFLYEAAVVSEDPGSPLLRVDLGSGPATTLNPGDRILSLDGLAVNVDGTNLEQHEGVTSMQFARAGSNTILTGTIII